MKRYNRSILMLYTAAILTGCNAESPVGSTDIDAVPLEITTGIESQVHTRSIVFGTQFSHEARIQVIGINQSTNILTTATYACKNPNGTSEAWVFTDKGIALSSDNMRVLARYPVGGNSTIDATSFTPGMKTTQAIGDISKYNSDNSFSTRFGNTGGDLLEVVMANEEEDYMTGTDQRETNGAPVYRTKTNKEVFLTTKHCMAIAVFHVKKSTLNTNPGIVKSILIQNKDANNGPLRKGKFDFETNAFTPDDRVEYKRTMDNFPDDCYYGVMVYPAKMEASSVTVQLEVDLITYHFDLPAKTWESGTILLYEIELLPTKAKLMDTVQVFDWEIGDTHIFEIN